MLDEITGVTTDESMVGFKLAKEIRQLLASLGTLIVMSNQLGEPYPGLFIQRKHPSNGMLIRNACTYVAYPGTMSGKLPFFVFFMPHLRPNDGGGLFFLVLLINIEFAAVQKLMNWWPSSKPKPHIVADAGYGSFALL